MSDNKLTMQYEMARDANEAILGAYELMRDYRQTYSVERGCDVHLTRALMFAELALESLATMVMVSDPEMTTYKIVKEKDDE